VRLFYCASAIDAILSSRQPALINWRPQASMVAPVVITSSTSRIRLSRMAFSSITTNASSTFSHRSDLVFLVWLSVFRIRVQALALNGISREQLRPSANLALWLYPRLRCLVGWSGNGKIKSNSDLRFVSSLPKSLPNRIPTSGWLLYFNWWSRCWTIPVFLNRKKAIAFLKGIRPINFSFKGLSSTYTWSVRGRFARHTVHKISSPLTSPLKQPRQYSGKNRETKSENTSARELPFDFTVNKFIFVSEIKWSWA